MPKPNTTPKVTPINVRPKSENEKAVWALRASAMIDAIRSAGGRKGAGCHGRALLRCFYDGQIPPSKLTKYWDDPLEIREEKKKS